MQTAAEFDRAWAAYQRWLVVKAALRRVNRAHRAKRGKRRS